MYGSTAPTTEAQFAQDYGLTPFTTPQGSTGYSGPSATGSGFTYVGPDGQVYATNAYGQETPGTPSQGSYQSYAAANPSVASQGTGFAQSVNPTASQLAGFAPASYQQFGNIPTIAPTTYNAQNTGAAQTDLSQMPGALQAFSAENAQAIQPTFDAQNMALNDNLGSRGIYNSGAASYLNNQLAQGQGATLAGMDAPLVSQEASLYGTAQLGNTANQQQSLLANQAAQNTAGATNAQAGNTANALNAGYYNSAVSGNQNNYNTYLNTLYGSGQNYANSLLGSYEGTYGGANTAPLTTLGQTPGAVQSAYNTGFSNAAPSGGFASGINSIEQAFSPSGGGNSQSNTVSGGGNIGDNTATASYS